MSISTSIPSIHGIGRMSASVQTFPDIGGVALRIELVSERTEVSDYLWLWFRGPKANDLASDYAAKINAVAPPARIAALEEPEPVA